MVVSLNVHTDCVVLSGKELCEIVNDLDLYRSKFEDLFRSVIVAYAAAVRGPLAGSPRSEVVAFRVIEQWVRDNYLDIREHLPPDLKRLYIQEMAFPPR